MALVQKREEAERLYVKKFMSCQAIAAALKINEGTVYRWKAKAAGQGEKEDWDAKRRNLRVSGQELIELYIDIVKDSFIELKNNPGAIWDSKKADAFTKHVNNIRKLDIRGQYMEVALELIKIINRWLAANQPELREKMVPCWDGIIQAVAEYATRKDLPWNEK
jgi:DNA-binding CsgD family transcriptional regulator